LPASVISTNPVPFESPMMAYSRPDGLTYPQQSLPEVGDPGKPLSGIQLFSRMPEASKVSATEPSTADRKVGACTGGRRSRAFGSSTWACADRATTRAADGIERSLGFTCGGPGA